MQGLYGVMLYRLKLTEYPQNDAIFEARDTGLAKPISFGVPTTSDQDAFIFSDVQRFGTRPDFKPWSQTFPFKTSLVLKILGFVEKNVIPKRKRSSS